MNPQVHMRWGSFVAAALPRRWAEALADRAGDLASRLEPPAREVVAANLQRLVGPHLGAPHVQGAFRTYARYYLAAMRLARLEAQRAVGALRWHGVEALDASLERGRGALILSAHLGNWDVVGLALARRYGALHVFVEPLQPAAVCEFYRRMRERHGMRVLRADAPGRRPFEVLRGNGLLALAADRPFGLRTERVPCGTGVLAVPSGGIHLALRQGAAIHPVFALRQAAGFEVRVGPNLAAATATLQDAAQRRRRVGSLFADELSQLVRRHPEQWCLLHPMDASPAVAAEQRGAA